jgi:transposase
MNGTKIITNVRAAKGGGIDVGKAFLDAAIDDPAVKPVRWPNTPEGRAAIVGFFHDHGAGHIGVEASGGYEIEIVAAMRDAGLDVVVLQPAQVRAYAKFLNQRAKTDPLDARLIARCVTAKRTVRQAPDPRLATLAERMTLIEQIEEDIARQRTRLDRFRDEALIGEIREEIARLCKRRRAALAELRRLVRAQADLAERLDLLVSIEGVGERTALTLVVRMPELGALSSGEAASLAGMAPFTRKSGRWQGESHVEGGRGRVGKALFAAAQAASQRWNPQLVAIYKRLRNAGKHHSVAIVACARKLIIYANTVLARKKPWEARA